MRVPARRLVGGVNKGWKLITTQLNHERVTLCSPGVLEQALRGRGPLGARDAYWPMAAASSTRNGCRSTSRASHAGLEFLRLINWKVAWTGTLGRLEVADASTIKVFGTEFYLEAFRLLMEILGERSCLKRGSPDALLQGHVESLYRSLLILTFGGGTNEIQRDLIGLFGLGLPRVPRF